MTTKTTEPTNPLEGLTGVKVLLSPTCTAVEGLVALSGLKDRPARAKEGLAPTTVSRMRRRTSLQQGRRLNSWPRWRGQGCLLKGRRPGRTFHPRPDVSSLDQPCMPWQAALAATPGAGCGCQDCSKTGPVFVPAPSPKGPSKCVGGRSPKLVGEAGWGPLLWGGRSSRSSSRG